MADNPFDRFDQPKPIIGGIAPFTLGRPDPLKAPQQRATLEQTQVEADTARRTQADEIRRKKAEADKAVADARIAARNAAAIEGAGLTPTSKVHGDAYLKSVPPEMVATVKGVASGNVPLPANALRSQYWQQVLQHTLNYDSEFNASDYNTRARTRADFASGKMSVNITALNTALGHAGEVMNDVDALGNASGLLGTSVWNPIANSYLRRSGDPRVTNFENDTMAFGGELRKVFSGSSGGGQAEREEWRTSIPINGSPEQQTGVLSHDARLLRSRLEALNEQYKRGMGRTADISDLLDPHAREVYNQLLAGGTLNVSAPPPPPSPPGSPPTGSNPPSDGSPPSTGGGTPVIASGATHDVPLKHVNGIINQMVRAGKSAADIGAAIKPYGS